MSPQAEGRPLSAAPTVSVVIPTRDRPRTVVQAIASARAQTLPPVEIWVVDDGTAPALVLPGEIAADPRVRLVRVDSPAGAAHARNEGIRRSAGELIGLLDDDDCWRPRFLERVAGRLATAPGDVALATAGFELWEGRRLVWRHRPVARDFRHRLLEHPAIAPSTVVVRRRAVEAVGGFDPAIRRTDDWELWLRLADRYRVVTVDEVLVDRTAQHPPPAVLLDAYDGMVARLAPRLAALPPRERGRIEAVHLRNRGVLLAQAGRRREARATLWRAWRRDPRAARPLVQLGRTVVGEPAWEALRRLVPRSRTSC